MWPTAGFRSGTGGGAVLSEVLDLTETLRARRLELIPDHEHLRVRPSARLTDTDRALIAAHKPAILAALTQSGADHWWERAAEIPPLGHYRPACLACGALLPPDRAYFCMPCGDQRTADIRAGRRRS